MISSPRRVLVTLWWAALMVAALVLAGCKSSPDRPSKPLTADFIGHRWRITVVERGATRVVVPAALDAWIELKSNGEIGGSDGVNGFGGTFRLTPNGFRASDDSVSSGMGVGGNPATLTLVDAFREILAQRPDVGADVKSGQLILSAPHYRITGVPSTP